MLDVLFGIEFHIFRHTNKRPASAQLWSRNTSKVKSVKQAGTAAIVSASTGFWFRISPFSGLVQPALCGKAATMQGTSTLLELGL